jgi:hypothetical protein
MVIDGNYLRDVLGRTENHIELRNEHGRCCRILTNSDALALDLDLFVGIGNRRRIRFLRFRTQKFVLNAGSHNTQRMTDGFGTNISHPLIREHRPVRGKEQWLAAGGYHPPEQEPQLQQPGHI